MFVALHDMFFETQPLNPQQLAVAKLTGRVHQDTLEVCAYRLDGGAQCLAMKTRELLVDLKQIPNEIRPLLRRDTVCEDCSYPVVHSEAGFILHVELQERRVVRK